jgi:hypothetical protein
MSGYTKTHRSVFTHDYFAGEEFSRREAWLWMISSAAWKPHRTRHKNKMIPIGRGQLPGARRHLAEVWGWGEQRVRTFIDDLVMEGMITTSSNQQLTIITICNYERFQSAEESSNQQLTSSQPAANHTEERKEVQEIEKKDSSDLFDEVAEAFEAYNRTAASCGLPSASKLTADRKTKIKARLKDYGVDGWKQALANIERSGFLTGQNDRGWKADLDFLVSPKSFGKIHDGGFGNGRHRSPLQVAKATGKSLFELMGKDGVLR